MKHKYLFGLAMCATFLFTSLCFADYKDEMKKMFRKQMIEGCMEGFDSSDDIPLSFAIKYCRCVADTALEKYSVAELMEIDEYEGEFENFADDMEVFGKECALKLLSNKKQ